MKQKIMRLLLCVLCCGMVFGIAGGASAQENTAFYEITDMPPLLWACIDDLGEAPTEEIIAAEFPYVYDAAGEFRVTAYCGCSVCNGKWTGYPAANGEALTRGLTIAVDPDVIPLGSYLLIEGVGLRKAQDTGSAVCGKVVDVYFETHADTAQWNTRTLKVWVIPGAVVDALARASENNYGGAQQE